MVGRRHSIWQTGTVRIWEIRIKDAVTELNAAAKKIRGEAGFQIIIISITELAYSAIQTISFWKPV